jgi:hypothetical protein
MAASTSAPLIHCSEIKQSVAGGIRPGRVRQCACVAIARSVTAIECPPWRKEQNGDGVSYSRFRLAVQSAA